MFAACLLVWFDVGCLLTLFVMVCFDLLTVLRSFDYWCFANWLFCGCFYLDFMVWLWLDTVFAFVLVFVFRVSWLVAMSSWFGLLIYCTCCFCFVFARFCVESAWVNFTLVYCVTLLTVVWILRLFLFLEL